MKSIKKIRMLYINKFACLLFFAILLGLSQKASSQFVGDTASVNTVAAVKEMKDNSWFTMEGHIVKQVREEKYLFRDQSGEVEIEIDNDKWQDRKVDPSIKVRIWGEVEKDFLSSVEVEVKRLELVGSNVKDQEGANAPR